MKTFSFIILLFTTILSADDIRFCSIGMGTFGTSTAKLAVQKGFKMVAAFTRYSKHTKTVGELLGMENDPSLQFEVSGMNKLEQIIDSTKPHFCIDATNSTLSDVFPHFRRLLAKGINIITLNNEAVFPNTRFNWKPKQLYRALNTAAIAGNAVILGGGYSDSILIPVIPSMTASMIELNKIRINMKLDVDGFGEKGAAHFGVGMTEKEFKENVESFSSYGISYWSRAVVEAIADTMDIPLLDIDTKKGTIALYTRSECYKVTNENGLQSNALGKVIPNGECAGMNQTILGRAQGNIEIYLSVILGVIPNINEINDVEVQLLGVPDLEFSIKDVNSAVVTGVSLLHRVPMVLKELKPGFYNVNELRPNRYWAKVDDWNVEEVEQGESSGDKKNDEVKDEGNDEKSDSGTDKKDL